MEKNKKGLVLKTIKRCYSLGHRISSSTTSPPKSKLWRRSKSTGRHQIAPDGCFTVCVGPDKMRFLIKTECVNHILFKLLLDEAEMEYGFASNGPLELPCDVELFQRVMWEMEQEMLSSPTWCSFPKAYGRYQLMSPGRLIVAGNF